MAQKPVLRGEVGCACVAREVSIERGGMGERGSCIGVERNAVTNQVSSKHIMRNQP